MPARVLEKNHYCLINPQTTKPPAHQIQSLQRSINKDILRIHEKMAQKDKENIYDCLTKLAFLNHLNWKAKSDIQSWFEVVHPNCNQVLIKEGGKIQYIYIIAKGEFEITKQIKIWDENNDTSNTSIKLMSCNKQYKLGSQRRSYYNNLSDASKTKSIRKSISYLGEGNLLWIADYCFNRNSSFTVTCKSFESTLYRIKVDDFRSKIMKSESSLVKLQAFCEAKDIENNAKLMAQDLRFNANNSAQLIPPEVNFSSDFIYCRTN